MPNLIGRIIKNRYEIIDSIGRGGMAEVYKVWDRMRATHLAMKLLHAELAQDVIFLRRFTREARTLQKLNHPNIVRFYGLDQDDLLAFILMEYIDGISLKTGIFRARGVGMPIPHIKQVIESINSALLYAHNHGYIHCDIKPTNILIEKNGRVVLTDFGIARMSDAATATMVGIGSPAYMAPEQIRGLDPTPQTDIYALGIVLYEMLTGGERPFTGEHAEITGTSSEKVRWEQLHLDAPSLREINSNIPNELDAIVLKCLDKNPHQRYPNIATINAAFKQCFTSGAVQKYSQSVAPAHVLGQIDTYKETDKLTYQGISRADTSAGIDQIEQESPLETIIARNKFIFLSGGLVFIVLLFVFGMTVFGGSTNGKPYSAEKQTSSGTINVSSKIDTPVSDSKAIIPTEINLSAHTPILSITSTKSPTPTPIPPTISPLGGGGGYILFNSDKDGDLEIYMIDLEGNDLIQLTYNSGTDASPSWSPDGKTIAFWSDRDGDNDIYVMNNDGTNVEKLTDNDYIDSHPVWSPDGKKIMYISDNYEVNDYEVFIMNADGSDKHNVTNRNGNDLFPTWSQDGERIIFAGVWGSDQNFDLLMMNPSGSNLERVLDTSDHEMMVDWSPVRDEIVFMREFGGEVGDDYAHLMICSTDGSNLRSLTDKSSYRDSSPAWSKDGEWIAFSSDRDGDFDIYMINRDGSDLIKITDNSSDDSGPEFHP